MANKVQYAIGIMLSNCFSTHVLAMAPIELFEKVSPSIFAVRALNANESLIRQGSGVVTAEKTVTTNCHVIAKAKLVQVRQGGVSYLAHLEHADIDRDLCLLKVPDLKAPAVRIAPSMKDLKVGQRAFAIGIPSGADLTLSEGMVSALRGAAGDEIPPIQISAPISLGSSGGGLFDESGTLIGITSMVGGQKVLLGHGIASPSEWIKEIPLRAQAKLARTAEQQQAMEGKNLTYKPKPIPALTAKELRQLIANSAPIVVGEQGPKITFESQDWWRVPSTVSTMTAPRGTWSISDDGAICLIQKVGQAIYGEYSGCYFAERRQDEPAVLVERKKGG